MLGTHTSVCRSASPVSYLNRKRALRNDMSRCVRGTAPARMQEAPLSGRLFEARSHCSSPAEAVAAQVHLLQRRLSCSGRMSEQSCPEFCLCAECAAAACLVHAGCLHSVVPQPCEVPSWLHCLRAASTAHVL